MAPQTSYSQTNAPNKSGSGASHGKRKREYLAYLDNKQNEIREQQDARRYYHGSQYTQSQIKAYNKRKQPIVTYNRVGRKINAVVGLLERQKQDPRGYPRTPKHEEGAEIATAVLRYVCDEQDWPAKSLISGLNGSVDGIGGAEIILEQGDRGDVEVGFEDVDPASFFYDPRSLKADFSDARYMGVGKWADLDAVIAMFPDKEAEIRASIDTGTELTSDPDSDKHWITGDEATGYRVRLVDHWYMVGNDWRWCIYTGSAVLAEGESYLKDEKNRSICKYIMYSANIDQDGDRYGHVRGMRSSQDEINARRSKSLHTISARRMIIRHNTGDDIETLRREAARPDGVIQYINEPPQFDDVARGQELQGQLAFLEDAKNEIENFGWNPALMGTGVDQLSGRAIQSLQQAGIAELGPYLIAFKNWKLRVYRAIWCAVQQHWTGERWIRVTDDDQVAQFFAVNKLDIDPMTRQPAIVNALGSLDVDIIIDEGPDVINMQQEVHDTLASMAQNGQPVPPELFIESSSLPGKTKQKLLDILEQSKNQPPNPQVVAGTQAEIEETNASARLKDAQAQKALADARAALQPQAGPEGPNTIDVAKGLADIRNTDANTAKTIAETHRTRIETALKPVEFASQQAEQDRARQERLTVHRDQMSQSSSQ